MGQSLAEPYPLPVLHALYEDRGIKMPLGSGVVLEVLTT